MTTIPERPQPFLVTCGLILLLATLFALAGGNGPKTHHCTPAQLDNNAARAHR